MANGHAYHAGRGGAGRGRGGGRGGGRGAPAPAGAPSTSAGGGGDSPAELLPPRLAQRVMGTLAAQQGWRGMGFDGRKNAYFPREVGGEEGLGCAEPSLIAGCVVRAWAWDGLGQWQAGWVCLERRRAAPPRGLREHMCAAAVHLLSLALEVEEWWAWCERVTAYDEHQPHPVPPIPCFPLSLPPDPAPRVPRVACGAAPQGGRRQGAGAQLHGG